MQLSLFFATPILVSVTRNTVSLFICQLNCILKFVVIHSSLALAVICASCNAQATTKCCYRVFVGMSLITITFMRISVPLTIGHHSLYPTTDSLCETATVPAAQGFCYPSHFSKRVAFIRFTPLLDESSYSRNISYAISRCSAPQPANV